MRPVTVRGRESGRGPGVEVAAAESGTERLGLLEKTGYALGDTATNLYFQFFNLFLFYYYTDVFGLNAAAVGTMYLVGNLWDAVNDPLMGAWADRTRTRYGRYRHFLLWFAVPYGVSGYLIFANPDLGPMGKLVYAYVTFIFFKMVMTAINIPYGAMMGVMTDDARDRVQLSTYRFLGAFGGGFVVSLLVRPLVKLFGGDREVLGFQYTMALFGVVSVLMFFFTFVTTKERLSPPAGRTDLLSDFKVLLRSRAWLVMFLAGICTLASTAVQGAVTVHYFKYVLGRSDEAAFTLGPEGTAFFLEFDLPTVFLSSGILAFIVGVACTGLVARYLGKRNGLIILTLLHGVSICGFFFVPPDALGVLFALNIVGKLVSGPTPALVWALYTDVADYVEWRHNRRATGLVIAGAGFGLKVGLTIGGAATGWLLSVFGFIPNQAQTALSLLGISLMFSIVPGALAVLNGVVLLFYPLSHAETVRMQAELVERRMRPDD